MNRSDSTTPPPGISMRTGPDTRTGPWAPPVPGWCSWLVRPDHYEFLFPAAARQPGRFPPAIRPRRQHRTEWNPFGSNDFRVQSGRPQQSSDRCTPARADCTSNSDPLSHNSFDADAHSGSSTSRPSGPAFHAHDGPALGGIASMSATGRRWHVGRVGHHHSNGAQSSAPIHDPCRTSTSTPAPAALPREYLHRVRANVEGGHAGTTHFGGGDRDKPAPGTQIQHPRPGISPVRCIASTSSRESSCGRYTVSATSVTRCWVRGRQGAPFRVNAPHITACVLMPANNCVKSDTVMSAVLGELAGAWANCLSIVEQNAGRSDGERLVIRLPSTTTSSSTTCAPALRRSVRMLGYEVSVRPAATPASTSVHGP